MTRSTKRARLPYKLRCDSAAHHCRDRRLGSLENALAAGVEAERDGCKILIAYVPHSDAYELVFDYSDPDAYAERREELHRLDSASSGGEGVRRRWVIDKWGSNPQAGAIEGPETDGRIEVVPLSEVRDALRRDLHSDSEETKGLAGPAGEAIADVSGSYSLEFTTSEQVAQGICNWLAAAFPSDSEEGS